MLLAEGWNSRRDARHAPRPRRQRLPAADRPDHARTHPRKEAGIVVDFAEAGYAQRPRRRLHSRLEADFYREAPASRRRPPPRPAARPRRLSPAPWLVPVTPDVARRLAVIQREWQRIDPKFLDEDEQRYWATIAGRQIRFDQRAEFAQKFADGRASKPALETFLSVCAAENPNRRLRMTALQDRVAMTVERADFDDLVTLVAQAPPGRRIAPPASDPARDRRGQGERTGADPAALDLEAREDDRKVRDRRASAEFPEAKRLLGAVANSRGHRHEDNVQKLIQVAKALPWRSARRCSPPQRATRRANGALDRAREELGQIEEIANALADNLPAEGAYPQASRRRKRKKKPADGKAQAAVAVENGAAPQPGEPKPRRRRRRRPSAAAAGVRRHRRIPRHSQAARGYGLFVLLLLAIGFVAGIVTALSPRAPGLPDRARRRRYGPPAARDRGGNRRQLHRLHALRRVAARPARPPDTCCATSRSRCSSSSRFAARAAGGGVVARPLQRLTRRSGGDLGGGFLLGASLGLVFVPCAGLVLAAVSVIAARRDVGLESVLLTLAYALGARADARDRVRRRAARRPPRPRRHRPPRLGRAHRRGRTRDRLRRRSELQTAVLGYTEALQRFERLDAAQRELRELTGGRDPGRHRRRHRDARGLRPGARLHRDRALAQLGAIDASRELRGRPPGSTSGRTRASTASGRCPTSAPGTSATATPG